VLAEHLAGRTALAAPFALALSLAASGCMDGLAAPFESETGQLLCSDAPDARYLSAAGTLADLGIALVDGDPPSAVPLVHAENNEPGLAVIGSSAEGDYQFYILNRPVIAEGSSEVVRSSVDDPTGIRLVIELERGSLGSIALDSLAGQITFDVVTDDELAGHFEAAFGTTTDQFAGCFHVDILSGEANGG
jgi:hypothetical protein